MIIIFLHVHTHYLATPGGRCKFSTRVEAPGRYLRLRLLYLRNFFSLDNL